MQKQLKAINVNITITFDTQGKTVLVLKLFYHLESKTYSGEIALL